MSVAILGFSTVQKRFNDNKNALLVYHEIHTLKCRLTERLPFFKNSKLKFCLHLMSKVSILLNAEFLAASTSLF